MMSGLVSVGYFLLTLFFSLLTFVLWIRLALRFFKISALHPISQAINTLTDPIITPIGVLFKSAFSRKNRFDWVTFGVLITVEWIKFITIAWLLSGKTPSLIVLLQYTLSDLIIEPCNLLFYAVIIRVVMSWINPHWTTPFSHLLHCITEPLLATTRRYVPVLSGLDLSPFVVMILLKMITLFMSASLPASFV